MVAPSKINVDLAVKCFRNVLNSSWPFLEPLIEQDKTESFYDDWLQANWEMIVECSIPPEKKVVLEIYSVGADCNEFGSRVWKPNAKATHQVVCIPKGNNNPVDAISGKIVKGIMRVEEFGIFSKGWIEHKPPFDFVNIDLESPCLIPVDGMIFEAWPLDNIK